MVHSEGVVLGAGKLENGFLVGCCLVRTYATSAIGTGGVVHDEIFAVGHFYRVYGKEEVLT